MAALAPLLDGTVNVHKLYALDIHLSELQSPTKALVEGAMKGHVLAETRLVGTYQKSG